MVCLRGSGLRVGKGLEVKRAGGAAIVLGNPPMYGSEVPVDAHVLPGTAVSMADVNTILKYINSSANPTAYLERSRTVVDVKPSPVMAQFSSRGPNVLEPSILKVLPCTNGMHLYLHLLMIRVEHLCSLYAMCACSLTLRHQA